jgi:hypothetical protein
MSIPKKGLIIRQPYIGKILDGTKTWEMRSTKTKIRGRIALIEAGSGMIVGEANLKFSHGKLSKSVLIAYKYRHQVDDESKLEKWCCPWVMEDVKRYEKPIPYKHPQGAVIWVNLENQFRHE